MFSELIHLFLFWMPGQNFGIIVGTVYFLEAAPQKWMLGHSSERQIIYLISYLLCLYDLLMTVKANKYVSVLYKQSNERNI